LWITDYPGETKTLARAREIVTVRRKELTQQFLVKMAVSEAFGGAIRDHAAPLIDLPPETFYGVLASLAQCTAFLSDPQVQAATATSSFSMGELTGKGMDRPTTVYVVIPLERIETQQTWLRLMIAAGIQTFKRKPPREGLRCMFLLDGFPALGRLDNLPRDIPMMAAYGVDLTLTAQSMDQVKNVYGDDYAAILGNCGYQWFCNVNELATAKYLNATLGDQTQDDVLDLGRDTAILLTPDSLPHYLRPVDYWGLPEAFGMFRKARPDLYWPLPFDPNPYVKTDRDPTL
jgi:type IV secretion system protein VirD4